MPKNEGESLRSFLREQKITQADLAMKTGVSRNTIVNYLKLKELPKEFKEELSNAHINWANAQNNGTIVSVSDANTMYVPLINKYAYAGYLTGYGDQEYVDHLPKYPFIVDKEHKGNYISIEVKGDSMDDGTRQSILEGDVLLGREVEPHHWQNKLHINRWKFIIVTKNDGILIKQISKHNKETGDITLHSFNEEYTDIEMNLKDVAKLFNVVQISIKA